LVPAKESEASLPEVEHVEVLVTGEEEIEWPWDDEGYYYGDEDE
jgi:hypothetical protein